VHAEDCQSFPDLASAEQAGLVREARVLTAMAVLLAVVFVAVPFAVSRTAHETGPAPSSGVYTTPTRGSLYTDGNFVEGVRRQPWSSGPAGADVPEPPLDTRHVVFAGTFPGGRWALVAGADPGGPLPPDDDGDGRRDLDRLGWVAIAWFTGPAGATPEQMTVHGVPRVVDADEPTALTNPATRTAVIVAAPDDRIEVSFLVRLAPDGTPHRDYEPVGDWHGVASLREVPLASLDRALRYRVLRDGDVLTGPSDAIQDLDVRLPEIRFDQVRAAPPLAPGDRAAITAIDDLSARTGVAVAFLPSFRILWAGDLVTRDGGPARLTVLAVETPDGPYYVAGALGWGVGSGQVATTLCGSEVRPAGTAIERAVVVVRCDRTGGTGRAPTDSLVVVAPRGTAMARALDADERVVAEYVLADGVAVAPVPPGLATVEVLDVDGTTVDHRAPMDVADLGV
jgi:hypothetical protein